jgi:hypothetical protein
MIDIHTKGWCKRISDSNFRDEISKTQHWTFEKRLAEVTELLKISKRTCENLLKGDDPHSFVGVPELLVKRTTSNQENNKRKGEQIRQGKKRAREEGGEEEDATPASPPKRAKAEPKGKKTASVAPIKARKTKKQ